MYVHTYKLHDVKPDVGSNAQHRVAREEKKRSYGGKRKIVLLPIKAISNLSQTSVLSTAPFKQHHNNHEGKKGLNVRSSPHIELKMLGK